MHDRCATTARAITTDDDAATATTTRRRRRDDDGSTTALSLGRVGPAPHTQHLLGPFAAIAQNSALWSFSIVDSLANGSTIVGVQKSLQFWRRQALGSQLGVSGSTRSSLEFLGAPHSE